MNTIKTQATWENLKLKKKIMIVVSNDNKIITLLKLLQHIDNPNILTL